MTRTTLPDLGIPSSPVKRRFDSIISISSAAILGGLCFSGYVKNSPLVDWLPIDPTLLSAIAALVLLSVYTVHNRGLPFRSMIPTVALWATFLPTMLVAYPTAAGQTKVAYLFTTTLLCALLPAIVGSTELGRRSWLTVSAIVGLALGVGTVLWPDVDRLDIYGRLNIEGGTTITTARAVGAALVIAVVVAANSRKSIATRMAAASIAVAAAALMLLIGSRGPFISVLIALSIVVVTARIGIAVKLVLATLLVFASIILSEVAVTSSTTGFSRILSFIAGDSVDRQRSQLYNLAIDQIANHPGGLGWYGFAPLASAGTPYPHNIVLEIAVEGGWLPGLAFLAYTLVALRRLWIGSRSLVGMALYALALYWLLAAQFSSDINGNRATWAALAFGFSTIAVRGVKGSEPAANRTGPRLTYDIESRQVGGGTTVQNEALPECGPPHVHRHRGGWNPPSARS